MTTKGQFKNYIKTKFAKSTICYHDHTFMYNTVGHVVTSAECHFMIHSLVRARNCEKGVFMRARK